MKYLIIGSGRLAKHLSFYFDSLNIPHFKWSRKEDLSLLNNYKANVGTVLLAISDSAIVPFYEANLKGLNTVHFSGALNHPEIQSVHPLMTFSEQTYAIDFYKKIPFAIFEEKSLKEIFPELPNPSFNWPKSEKAFYHTLCVLSGNGTTLLLEKIISEFSAKNISLNVLRPYFEKILANAFSENGNALTGPIARKDFITLEKNLDSLSNDKYQKVFTSLVQTKIPEFHP